MSRSRTVGRRRHLAALTAGALLVVGAPVAWAAPESTTQTPAAGSSAASSSAAGSSTAPSAARTTSTAQTTSAVQTPSRTQQVTTTQPTPTTTATVPTTPTTTAQTATPSTTTPTSATQTTATETTAPQTTATTADEAETSGAATESGAPKARQARAGEAEARTATNLGALSVTSGGPWGSIVPNADGKSASGSLPAPSVSTSVRQSWVATITSSDFVNGSHVIPCSAVTYRVSSVTRSLLSGSATSTEAQTGLCSPKDVVVRDDAWALDITTWTANLTVAYPEGAAIGTYRGTITVSVY